MYRYIDEGVGGTREWYGAYPDFGPLAKDYATKLKRGQLAACIALRVVGAVFVIVFRRWRTNCTVFQPVGSTGRYLKKSPKPC
jgi:hypothetical protein